MKEIEEVKKHYKKCTTCIQVIGQFCPDGIKLWEKVWATPKEEPRWWEKELYSGRPQNDHSLDETNESLSYRFGHKHRIGNQIHEVTDWGNIKNFIREVEKKSFEEGVSATLEDWRRANNGMLPVWVKLEEK